MPRGYAPLNTLPTRGGGAVKGRSQRPGQGYSLTGGEGRSSRRLRQRRSSSSSAGSCRCGRRARSIPHTHTPLPALPPRLLSRCSRRCSRHGHLSPCAGARTGSRTEKRVRPPPPPPTTSAPGRQRTREAVAGARAPQGAGTGRAGPAPPPVRPPTHAVAGQLSCPTQVAVGCCKWTPAGKSVGTELL